MQNLITLTDPRSSAAEAYQSLRTNLEFSSLEQPLHSSSSPAQTASPIRASPWQTWRWS